MLCSRRVYSSRISCSSGVRRPGPEVGVWWGGVVDIVVCCCEGCGGWWLWSAWTGYGRRVA